MAIMGMSFPYVIIKIYHDPQLLSREVDISELACHYCSSRKEARLGICSKLNVCKYW